MTLLVLSLAVLIVDVAFSALEPWHSAERSVTIGPWRTLKHEEPGSDESSTSSAGVADSRRPPLPSSWRSWPLWRRSWWLS